MNHTARCADLGALLDMLRELHVGPDPDGHMGNAAGSLVWAQAYAHNECVRQLVAGKITRQGKDVIVQETP